MIWAIIYCVGLLLSAFLCGSLYYYYKKVEPENTDAATGVNMTIFAAAFSWIGVAALIYFYHEQYMKLFFKK